MIAVISFLCQKHKSFCEILQPFNHILRCFLANILCYLHFSICYLLRIRRFFGLILIFLEIGFQPAEQEVVVLL